MLYQISANWFITSKSYISKSPSDIWVGGSETYFGKVCTIKDKLRIEVYDEACKLQAVFKYPKLPNVKMDPRPSIEIISIDGKPALCYTYTDSSNDGIRVYIDKGTAYYDMEVCKLFLSAIHIDKLLPIPNGICILIAGYSLIGYSRSRQNLHIITLIETDNNLQLKAIGSDISTTDIQCIDGQIYAIDTDMGWHPIILSCDDILIADPISNQLAINMIHQQLKQRTQLTPNRIINSNRLSDIGFNFH